ncbi:unnamed protein product [Angiostrongylus costaricensis]|uniref:Dual specificity protein phosphatase n=1 Tax=Angiostrongylus costaricensis TaxID=334426 RepID=A0A0R3PLE6_ANGCS|nr:unnamed protein product [Angiostrongylus costaricensis]
MLDLCLASLLGLSSASRLLFITVFIVVLEDGREVIEHRDETGAFVSSTVEDDEVVPGISNRRIKKIERIRRAGFVIDNQPDLQLAEICQGVYLGKILRKMPQKSGGRGHWDFLNKNIRSDHGLDRLEVGRKSGSQDVASELAILKAEGITHIVNCATGVMNYYPTKFTYYNLEVLDLPSTDIMAKFHEVCRFMVNCVGGGGKVLVHCNAGISRSATFVIAYLMIHHSMSLQCALETVRRIRPKVRPNCGFMKQLQCFEKELFSSLPCEEEVVTSC